MTALVEMIESSLDESAPEAISAKSGVPRNQVQAAIPPALTMLTSGLSKSAASDGGQALLDADGDGSVIDEITEIGGSLLGRLFGGSR